MQFYIVDVFAEEKYAGNQLAVIRGKPSDAMMQTLGLEMYFSETTFITSEEPENGGYNVRIFTPASELPFAGHPTLGTAFIVRQEIIGKPVEQVNLNFKVGQVPVRFDQNGVIWMQQNPPKFGHIYSPEEVAPVLGLSVNDIDSRFPIQDVSTGMPHIMCPLKTMDAVKRAVCDVPKLGAMVEAGKNELAGNSIFIFANESENPQNDFHARAFVPFHGIPEDPATGSANGNFAGWLAKYRYFGDSKMTARVEQGYEIKRPSLLLLEAEDHGDSIEVHVGGRVQMIAQGTLVD